MLCEFAVLMRRQRSGSVFEVQRLNAVLQEKTNPWVRVTPAAVGYPISLGIFYDKFETDRYL